MKRVIESLVLTLAIASMFGCITFSEFHQNLKPVDKGRDLVAVYGTENVGKELINIVNIQLMKNGVQVGEVAPWEIKSAFRELMEEKAQKISGIEEAAKSLSNMKTMTLKEDTFERILQTTEMTGQKIRLKDYSDVIGSIFRDWGVTRFVYISKAEETGKKKTLSDLFSGKSESLNYTVKMWSYDSVSKILKLDFIYMLTSGSAKSWKEKFPVKFSNLEGINLIEPDKMEKDSNFMKSKKRLFEIGHRLVSLIMSSK